jgi:hypothetical protein
MRKQPFFDLIHRVSELTGIEAPIIVGSHTIYALTDQVPTIVRESIEADFLLAEGGIEAIRGVNKELGVTSDFYDESGYYADGLGLATVVLVPGWQDRLQPFKDETGQVVARCLELHDTAVSKLMAGRDKNYVFLSEILANRLISLETLAERAALILETVHEDALLPRLQKLFDYLRKQQTTTDLKPLSELINRLS